MDDEGRGWFREVIRAGANRLSGRNTKVPSGEWKHLLRLRGPAGVNVRDFSHIWEE